MITKCQFCGKKEWQIKLECHGFILKYPMKWLICNDCYEKIILKKVLTESEIEKLNHKGRPKKDLIRAIDKYTDENGLISSRLVKEFVK